MQSAIESWVARALGSIAERFPTPSKHKEIGSFPVPFPAARHHGADEAQQQQDAKTKFAKNVKKIKQTVVRMVNDEKTHTSIARAVSVGTANGLLSFVVTYGQRGALRLRRDTPKPCPVLRPAIVNAYWSVWRGFHTELLNEVLLRIRGPKHFRSNAFISGALFGLWDARDKTAWRMIRHSARAGGQELLVASIFGEANPALEFENEDEED